MGKKRTKSKATTSAKKPKKAADSNSDEKEQTVGLIVAPVAKATTTTLTTGNKKAAEAKKSLSANAIADLKTLAVKAQTGKLVAEDFKSLTVNDIKNALRSNDRPRNGNRGELIKKTIDCMTEGCPPRCPACGGGRLRFGARGRKCGGDTRQFHCPGYMDDDEFINCNFTATRAYIDLIQWKDPQ